MFHFQIGVGLAFTVWRPGCPGHNLEDVPLKLIFVPRNDTIRLMSTCIQTTDLTKCYGNTVAVGGLSFEVETGEVFGLLGPNGAGKSTTLYMLTGLVPPSSGKISIFNKDLAGNYLTIASRFGVLVERPSFYDHLSVRQNLLLLARLARREVTIDKTLDRVGMLDVASQKAGTLSSGMLQRLGLAQALLTEPELLILDEPTNGLDVESTQDVLRLLRRLADEAKVTIVLSSHMMNEVETLCDRVAVMNRGRMVSCERTDALLSYDETDVEVLLDVPEAAAKRLNDQEWVTVTDIKPGRLHVRLNDRDVHHLMTYLTNAGYKLSGVIPRRRTLVEYFLKVLNP